MYKRILVPVDGSETSTRALVAALQMARDAGGSVRVIHVIEELAQLIAYDPYGAYPADLARTMRDSGHKILADAKAVAASAGVPCDERLVEASGQRLGDAVCQEAAGYNADLIAVGTHGRRGIGRVLMGSGAEQIIRQAQVPVLVIRGLASEGSESPQNARATQA